MTISQPTDTLSVIMSETNPEIIRNDHLVCLVMEGLTWLGIALIGLLLISLVYKAFPHRIERRISKLLDNYLPLLVCIVWVLGFITYCVGMHLPVENNFFTVVPMAMIHATEMFFSISDISAIHQDCYNSRWFMTMYNISHFGAVMLSMIFLIRQFGVNIVEKIRFWGRSIIISHSSQLKTSSKNKLKLKSNPLFHKFSPHFLSFTPTNIFIFWGINETTINLARSTSKKIEQNNSNLSMSNSIIVFVRTSDKNQDETENIGIARVFKLLNIKNKKNEKLNDIKNCYITSSRKHLSMLDLNKNGQEYEDEEDSFNKDAPIDILCDILGLDSLVRIICANKNTKSHFFFLGDNQDSNIAATINLLKDKTVKENYVTLYCKARKSAKTQWLEFYNYLRTSEHTTVNIVDTAYLSISQLKQKQEHHPVKYLDFDKEGRTIDGSAFNSLVLGFGETGIEAVKFLYEFGAFVDKKGEKTPFHCTVIDDNMAKKKGLFEVLTPGLRERNEIELLSYPINSEEYWKKIQDVLPTLNYIIVCLGNDDVTLETVANICNMAIRCRNTKRPLKICVRSYSGEKDNHLETICMELFNDNDDEINEIEVTSFGSISDIFTYDLIVLDKLLDEAKKYNLKYKQYQHDKIEQKGEYKGSVDDAWNEVLGIIDNHKYTIVELEEIARKRDANFSNSLHRKTKLFLLKDNPSDELKKSVQMIEHERWNSSMRLLGWVYGENKDAKLKTHPGICPYSLQKEKRYDEGVIEVSLGK